jgi:hypothetical protein
MGAGGPRSGCMVGGFATGGLLAGPCGLFVAQKTRADLMPAAKQYPHPYQY